MFWRTVRIMCVEMADTMQKGHWGYLSFLSVYFPEKKKKSFEFGSYFKFLYSWYTAGRKLKNLELARKVCG